MNAFTLKYLTLKDIADEAMANAEENAIYMCEAFDLECECATYAYENEDKIEWELINA